jgi:hypothetical protein
MRSLSSNELEKIKLLTENSVEITFIEPTYNGLQKSIMDATVPVRAYLKSRSIHDFENQKQGPDNKVLVKSYLIEEEVITHSEASLYRPVTKKGDPRIWFKKLNSYANANDILGICELNGELYVLNITKLNILRLLKQSKSNPLKEIIQQIKNETNETANELLKLLYKIAARGPIPGLLQADTSKSSWTKN